MTAAFLRAAGRLRPEQAVFLDRIRRAGGVAFVARDYWNVLRELGRADLMVLFDRGHHPLVQRLPYTERCL